MISLAYVSSATSPFSDSDLVDLLRRSRYNNSRLDVTGMLLHKDGNFMQVLEGPDDAVWQLFKTIGADSRHQGVIRMLERQIDQHEFSDWTMAFRNLNDPGRRDILGYSEFMNESLNSERLRTDPKHAHRLIEVFRRNMNR